MPVRNRKTEIQEQLVELQPERALTSDFYNRPTEVVARELLGKLFVRHIGDSVLSGIIVETEAYLPEGDEASHAWRGRTRRNAAMFEQGGILYVYMIYGIHYCLNFVTEERDLGCAVLLRAVEPVHGIAEMRARRGVQPVEQLCNGPGKVAAAFGLTTDHSFTSACGSGTYVQPGREVAGRDILATPRIGITKSAGLPLRFSIKNSAFVSKPRPVAQKTGGRRAAAVRLGGEKKV